MGKDIITKEDIRKIAEKFLVVLVAEKINELSDLERKMGQSFPVLGMPGDKVTTEFRPSEPGSRAYAVSYFFSNGMIPIEARLNPILDNTKLIIKGHFRLRGYAPFSLPYTFDIFGNIAQSKEMTGCSVFRLKDGLKLIASSRRTDYLE